jgi:hypothetical protein
MKYAFTVFFANQNWTLCVEGADIDEAFDNARNTIREKKLHSASIRGGRVATEADLLESQRFMDSVTVS